MLVLLTVVLGGISLYGIGTIDRDLQSIATDALPGVISISAAEGDIEAYRGNVWKHLATADPTLLPAVEQKMEELKREIQGDLHDYEKTIMESEDRAMYAKIAQPLARCLQVSESILPLSREMKKKEAFDQYMAEADPAFVSARTAILALVDYNRKSSEVDSAGATSASRTARLWTWTLLLGSIVLGGLLSLFIVRNVNRELQSAIKELGSGAEQVASAAAQVASSSQALSQGTSEQAASLEETSATSEEINAMARRNTENSKSAAQIVTQSEAKFVETTQALDSMVQSMSEIGTSSEKISKIIKVIDDIAFQTNILALNAAVEAARAGDAGQGFAVVADEVRNLAQRCAQAAKDTAALIEDSIAKSTDGKTKVDQVAVLVRSVAAESAKIKTLVDEVSGGSEEQARGIEQIARAVQQMQTVTQTSAATAEESAAAAEEMTAQSEAVRDVVERLRMMVEREDAAAERTAVRVAARHQASGDFGLRPCYHTAGALGQGERIWILAKLPSYIRVLGDDITDKYLLLTNTHDATTGVQVKFTPIRVVCQNTLATALKGNGSTISVPHTRNVIERLDLARRTLNTIDTRYRELEETFKIMAKVKMDSGRLTDYVAAVFPDPKNKKDQVAIVKVAAARSGAALRFESGKGNDLPGVKGTLWAAYNGVTEMIDHGENRRSDEQQLNYIWFGVGAAAKVRAYDQAAKLAAVWA